MVERIKNKKGFTIIEIMVVIALIGILAAVLVPKFGGVRNTARDAGMLTNVKIVEAYVASQLDNYKDTDGAKLKDAINKQFQGTNNTNKLKNPYTGAEDDANIVVTVGTSSAAAAYPTTGNKGVVYVSIDHTSLKTFINGMDASGNEIVSTERTLER